MRTLTKALTGAAALALVGIGVPAAMADTSIAPDASLVDAPYLQPITYPSGTHYPGAYGLDTNGDKQADVYGYCVEPGVSTSSAVRAQTQQLTAYDSTSRTFIQDGGRTRWVASHGFGAVAPTDLASKSGISVNLMPGSTDFALLQEATQAAIWRYSAGLAVPSSFTYGSSADNQKFWAVYTYLVQNAVPVDTKTVVYDEKSGDAQTQAIIVVTPGGTPSAPVTDPSKPTDPTPDPTKPVDPTPTDTKTVAPWTPGPDALRVSVASFYRITMSNNAYAPSYAGFDITGDKVADLYGYCIEPFTGTSAGVSAWTQKFGAYDSATRTDFQDGGRVRWVATHGYGALSGPDLASKVGITVSMASGSTDIPMLQSATQAAIWRFTSGLVVNPLWHFGYTSADNAKFWKVYSYLVQNAVPVDTKVTVYDSKPGEPSTQGYVVVTPPTSDPVKAVDPTKAG